MLPINSNCYNKMTDEDIEWLKNIGQKFICLIFPKVPGVGNRLVFNYA